MRKWRSFETRFVSLRDDLRKFLKDNEIKYELSGAYSFYHFEIYVDNEEANMINSFIDSVSITEW